MKAILALDLGSTQLKLQLMGHSGDVIHSVTEGYPTHSPRPGWLEQNPADWERALESGLERLLSACPATEIAAIGFSGHMSGAVLLDREGRVLYPCIMLSDSRSEEEARFLQEQVGDAVRSHTGNAVINAFTLPKLLWLKRHAPAAWRQAQVWIAPKDYLRYLLTSEIATESTDAFNSLCVDAQTAAWCDDIIRTAGLEKEKFPEMLSPQSITGAVTPEAAKRFHLPSGIPVAAGGADMACGALGMGLFQEGESALTLGTCATFLAAVPAVQAEGFGKVTFHLHAIPGMLYALGSHFNGGQAINWLSRLLSPEGRLDYGEIAALSRAAEAVAPGSGGVTTVPFLAGSGSPYFDAADRQAVFGLSTASGRGEIFRSELEGITLNLDESKQLFDAIIPGGLKRVLLGGGGVKIGVWPQMIADIFDRSIDVAANADASTVGAAILAGTAVGFFTDAQGAAARCLRVEKRLVPQPGAAASYAPVREKYELAYHLARQMRGL